MNGQPHLISMLRQINEYDFECLIADLWTDRGWKTRVLQASNDRGIDVEARRTDPFQQKHLIQAKRYSADNNVGSEMIQQYSSLQHQEENVDAVIIITTSDFTKQAKEVATDLNIKLINGDDLVRLIRKQDATDIVRQYISIENDNIDNVQETNQHAPVQSLQTLNPTEIPAIYISKLSDNAIGDSVTENRLARSKTGTFLARTKIDEPIIAYLYKNEQPHFLLRCVKISHPNQKSLDLPNNTYFVATDKRVFYIISNGGNDEMVTVFYEDMSDVTEGGFANPKIKIETDEGQRKFLIADLKSDDARQEVSDCVQYIKNNVYSLI